jgi:hypothetical protein
MIIFGRRDFEYTIGWRDLGGIFLFLVELGEDLV